MAKAQKAQVRADVVTKPATNGLQAYIDKHREYNVRVKIAFTSDMLYHRYNTAAVKIKAAAQKGSDIKKMDDPESYVWRMDDENPESNLAVPCYYFCAALANAAKNYRDPSSRQASLNKRFRSSVLPMEGFRLADVGIKRWHRLDEVPVVVQQARIPRSRPALLAGTELTFFVTVTCPEVISPELLHKIAEQAGKTQGLADGRPINGRFRITGFDVIEFESENDVEEIQIGLVAAAEALAI